jgi:hypothetical protein
MYINPATHTVVMSGTTSEGTVVADFTVEFTVIEDNNIVSKHLAGGLITAGNNAIINPSQAEGKGYRIDRIVLLAAAGTANFSIRLGAPGNPGSNLGPIVKGTLLPNEFGVYSGASGSWTRYDTGGVPYGRLSGGGA